MSLHLSEPLSSSELPRVHRHHSHQSHLADQDPTAAGNQVRNLKPLCHKSRSYSFIFLDESEIILLLTWIKSVCFISEPGASGE